MKLIFNWINKPFALYPDNMERLVYLLIFLFPIAGMSVRHWISNIFNLLVLIGLFALRKEREPLLKQERFFLWVCAAYFASFILSSLVNGWGVNQTYYLGTELRFLFVIPLYLLVRRYSDCSLWLLRGAVVGGFFLFAQAYYDVYVMGSAQALGVYSKNLIGTLAVVVGFWGLYHLLINIKSHKWPYILFGLLSVMGAFFTASLSGSRGAYVGFVVTGLLCVVFFSRPRWMLAILLIVSLSAILFYQNSSIVKRGVDVAVNETQQYFRAEDHVKDVSSNTSTGIRLEMLRTGLLFIEDNPFTGIGGGNYADKMQGKIKAGLASPAIGRFDYPHNAFMEVATAKGILGLITVLLIFYYPAYLYIKGYKACKPTAVLGLIHIVAISAFSLTDHSVIVKNNYTSILLLGIVIFLAGHIRACRKHLSVT
ncbi:O-antigen ligase family protein [Beggiatoa alba]|nr:O-antigen ligase family protein [Beggiatoa alba]